MSENLTPKLELIHIFCFGIFAGVSLNGTIIYHEDSDKGHNQEFTTLEVARRLSKALNKKLWNIEILQPLPDEWNWDIIEDFCEEVSKIIFPDFPAIPKVSWIIG